MKKASAVLICLVFIAGTAVASPFGEGGGTSPGEEESNLATILMITVVVGFTALLVSDIIADDGLESQDALAGITASDTSSVSEETGVNWEQLAPADSLPVLAIAVFQGPSGREAARYMASLLSSRENIDYTIHGSPSALGHQSPSETASTGFAFVPSDYFITADQEGLFLFHRGSGQPEWSFPMQEAGLDSAFVRRAAASLMEHFELP
ncbi:MAG TPA: hypothetical protein PK991_02950 [Candidatus Sabulitectum sp.]|nr:hypothetical protein [Candidatus Sabulitectum sp.]